MSTLDKINEELSGLEKELSQLHHYTNEIGDAKDAAKSVISMSLSFLSDFKEKVSAINTQMDTAANDFKKSIDKSSGTLDAASGRFYVGISEAKKALDEISGQLTEAADNVNHLTAKIEAIDILGHFSKLHESFPLLQRNLEAAQNKIERRVSDSETIASDHYREVKKLQIASIVIMSVLTLIVLITFFLK